MIECESLPTQHAAPNEFNEPDLDLVLPRIADRLSEKFVGVFSPETVHRFVAESCLALQRTARVQRYLPALTERFAAERLAALGQAEGLIAKDCPEVLFVCVQNAGRYQMAAALLEHYAAGRVHVRSAGSKPAAEVSSAVWVVMTEMGINFDAGALVFPKPLTEDVLRAADIVVTMGCGDACTVYPGKRYLDWNLADPAGQQLSTVRQIRDDIGRRVRFLLAEIDNARPPTHTSVEGELT